MATQAEINKLKADLAKIQSGYNEYSGTSTYNVSGSTPDLGGYSPAPSGQVAGASYTVPGTNVPFRNEQQASVAGYYGIDTQQEAVNYGNQQMGIGGGYVQPKISSETAKNMGSALGIGGKEFEGLTQSQANAKLDKMKKTLQEQTSANTSSILNPETLAGFKKQLDQMRVSLDTTNNDTWKSQQERKDINKATVDSYTGNMASLFTPENLQQAMQNPEFQKLAEQYKSMGGDINAIAAKVSKPTVTVTGETPNPDGTYTVRYSDGTSDVRRYSMNADGTYTSNEAQTLDQYLGTLKTPEQQKAYQTLMPENKIAQEELAFEQSIPEEYKKYYFGTPEQIGLQQQLKAQAEETKALLERKKQLDTENLRAQADYVMQENNADMQASKAKVEENRLASKNYMTGMLAKLGALNTSSSAPIAIAELDQKYQKQSQEIENKTRSANRQLEIKLKEATDAVDIDTEEAIQKIQNDLTKSDTDAFKEIAKLKIDANRRSYDIINKFATNFRTQTAKYEAETKAAAKKYAKDYLDKASTYDVSGLSFNEFINKKQEASLQTFGMPKRQALVPEFLQNLLSSGSISSQLENVLAGKKSLADYSATNRAKIEAEMKRLGVTRDMIGKGLEGTSGDVGALSKANLTKGLNYILTSGGTKEDQEKFKTDRGFQAYIMSQI